MRRKRKLIGTQLRELRERMGLTVAQAADRAGLDAATVRKIEESDGGLFSSLRQLAHGYGKRIAVRGFYYRHGRINAAEFAREAGIDARTLLNAMRVLASPYNIGDHLAREWPEGTKRPVLLEATDPETITLETILAEWSPEACFVLE